MRSIARFGTALIVVIVSLTTFPAAVFAGWEPADITAVNIKKVCRDGIKFEAGVLKGNNLPGDYHGYAVVTDPPPPEQPVPSDTVVIRAKIKIPKHDKTVKLPGGEPLELSHYRSVEMRFHDDLPVGHTVAVNVQDFAVGTGYSQQEVEDCKL